MPSVHCSRVPPAAVRQELEMPSVHCSIVPPAAIGLFEISKFTVFGFLPSTVDASEVPRHGSVNLGLGDSFLKLTALDPPCSTALLVGFVSSPRTESLEHSDAIHSHHILGECEARSLSQIIVLYCCCYYYYYYYYYYYHNNHHCSHSNAIDVKNFYLGTAIGTFCNLQ